MKKGRHTPRVYRRKKSFPECRSWIQTGRRGLRGRKTPSSQKLAGNALSVLGYKREMEDAIDHPQVLKRTKNEKKRTKSGHLH